MPSCAMARRRLPTTGESVWSTSFHFIIIIIMVMLAQVCVCVSWDRRRMYGKSYSENYFLLLPPLFPSLFILRFILRKDSLLAAVNDGKFKPFSN